MKKETEKKESSMITRRHWFDFLLSMTEKEIKARYKHAALGFLWVILNPLLQMVVIGFIFQFFVPVKVDNYFLYLFTGLLPWNFFAYSISKTVPGIVHERALVQKAKFPREAILLSIVFSNLFHLLISLGLLMLLLVADKVVLEQYTLRELLIYLSRFSLVIPLTAWLTTLTSGLSLLLASWNVKYRDVNFMVQAVLPLWFYATPIIYSLNLLPPVLQRVAYLNPLTGITQLFHYALLSIDAPSWSAVGLSLFVTIILTAMGIMVFRKGNSYFDDWL